MSISPIHPGRKLDREEVEAMDFLFVEILAPVITGCLVAIFVYWLDKRDER